jgi:putative membrane protein
MMGNRWGMNGAMGWGGPWLMMSCLAIACLVVVGIFLLLVVRGLWHPSHDGASNPQLQSRAEAMLDERFARGDIDEQEYTSRRAVLAERRRPA